MNFMFQFLVIFVEFTMHFSPYIFCFIPNVKIQSHSSFKHVQSLSKKKKKKKKVPLRTFLTSFLFFLKSNSSLFIDNLLFPGALFHGSPAKVPKKGMIGIYLLHFITYILFYHLQYFGLTFSPSHFSSPHFIVFTR